MNWKPTNRWVAPYYEIVNSETRHPSAQYESGYARRLFSATPALSILNVLAQRVWLYVSFYNFDGVAQVDSATKRNRAEVIRCFSPYFRQSHRSRYPHGGCSQRGSVRL